jgi:hypothetical protein
MTLWIEIATTLHLLNIAAMGDEVPSMALHEYRDGAFG